MPEAQLPPQQALEPLQSVSPSRFLGLLRCPLQGVRASLNSLQLLPVTPSARLGTAAHALLEEAGRGQTGNTDTEALDRRWTTLVAKTESEMRESWLERHLVPLQGSVAKYEVRRIQVRERAREIADGCHAHGLGAAGAAGRYGYELFVSSADGAIRGRIDAALPSPEGPVLRDYKTGNIWEDSEVPGGVIKAAYEVQLRLYAALYAASTGTWPARLEIVPGDGPPVSVEVRVDECLRLVEEAKALLARVNKTISELGSASAELEAALGRPDAETCRFCASRPACSPYLQKAPGPGQDGWPMDVTGRLIALKVLGNGRMLLTLEASAGLVHVSGLGQPPRHPALVNAAPGIRLGIYNLRALGSGSTFGESQLTTIYRLPPTP
jgi:hypothetical protein